MKVYFDLSNPAEASELQRELSMCGSNPVHSDNRSTIGPVEVRDSNGSVILTVGEGVCRRLGEVRNVL
jgi:hypothetical protein